MILQRTAAVVAIIFGVVGIIACIAGMMAVRSLESRAAQSHDRLFQLIDAGLVSAQDMIHRVDERIAEARGTTAELKTSLQSNTTAEAIERLASQVDIQRRADALVARLQSADSALETSLESIRGVRNTLELCDSLGVRMNPASIDRLLEIITSLRSSLRQSRETVDGIVLVISQPQNKSHEEQVSHVLTLFDRIVPLISKSDELLNDASARVSEVRSDAGDLKTNVSNWIMRIAVIGFVLLGWIAAGQLALCRWGRSVCRTAELKS
jgi:exonuclease VII small subunit